MESEAKPENVDSIILEEEIDPNYVPSESEVLEYAQWLGMDLDKDQDLFWIAREGLKAPLPENWKPCKTKDTDTIYYFNFTTGESTWDHPCDGFYKRLYEEEKKKKEIALKENNDAKRNQAKQDVKQLLGKNEKKKRKVDVLDSPGAKSEATSLAPVLERKPLPGIKPLGPLSSNLKSSVAELKREEETGHSQDVATADNSSINNAISLKSSTKLGMIGSLRAGNESSGNLMPLTSATSTNVDAKISERPIYREESKPIVTEEKPVLSDPGSTRIEYTADAKELSSSRSEGGKSVPQQGPALSPSSTGNTVNFEHQERTLRAEIDRLMADNVRLTKKAEYWEHEVQNCNRKIDQNAVYYNDRINTLDSELLDAKRQVVAKDEELYSLNNRCRSAETELSRSKELLSSNQADASRKQQLHADTLAVEQRKLQALENQLKELQMSCYAKDDEIRRLQSTNALEQPSTGSIENTTMVAELQSKLRSVEQKNESIIQELRDVKRQLDNDNQEAERLRAKLQQSEASAKKLEELRIELTKANEQSSLLMNNLLQKENELERAHAQLQSMLNDMTAKLQDAEKSKLFLTHNIAEKDQELAVLRRKLDVFEQQQLQHQPDESDQQLQERFQLQQERELLLIAQQEQEVANLRSKIENLRHELSLLQINSTATTASLQMKTEESDTQKANLIRLQDLVAELEREKKDRDSALLQVNAQLDSRQVEIARLQSSSNQVSYLQEVVKLHEKETAQLKAQLVAALQQKQQQHQSGIVSSTPEFLELQSEANILRTKLEAKSMELRSKTEEVVFLQNNLDAAYRDLSTVQNAMRNATSELKALRVEQEGLQHQLQSETEAGNAKDKKIRGFREELLHLQKRLSEMESMKRRDRDVSMSDAETQTRVDSASAVAAAEAVPAAKKAVCHVGVQKSITTNDVAVHAGTHSRDSGAQTLNNTPHLRFSSTQTDFVTYSSSESHNSAAQQQQQQPSEMKQQMNYIKEIREELSDKMEQCNQLLASIASSQQNRQSSSTNKVADVQRGEGHVQIVHDENRTPNNGHKSNSSKNPTESSKVWHRHQFTADYANADIAVSGAADELDSVSEVLSPEAIKFGSNKMSLCDSKSLVEQLGELLSHLQQGTLHYTTSTHSLSRFMRQYGLSTSQSTAMNEQMCRKGEQKQLAAQSLLETIRVLLQHCKNLIRQGRSNVADMKRSYHQDLKLQQHRHQHLARAKAHINEVTADLNLAIQLARYLQQAEAQLKDYTQQLQLLLSVSSSRSFVKQLCVIVTHLDDIVDTMRDTAHSLLQQLTAHRATGSSSYASSYRPACVNGSDVSDAVEHDNVFDEEHTSPSQEQDLQSLSDFYPIERRTDLHGRRKHLYPSRSVSPPNGHHSHLHQHHRGHKASNYSAHHQQRHTRSLSRASRSESPSTNSRRRNASASNSHSIGVGGNKSEYRDKLDIIQRQLSNAHQKQAASLREYDRHYSWLGSLVKEIGQQTAPVGYRSLDLSKGKSLNSNPTVRAVPLSSFSENVILDANPAGASSTSKQHFYL